MRTFVGGLIVILLLIGLAGLGAGVIAIVTALDERNSAGIVAAMIYGGSPFLIGTVALGAATIAISIEEASRDQIEAIDRGSRSR